MKKKFFDRIQKPSKGKTVVAVGFGKPEEDEIDSELEAEDADEMGEEIVDEEVDEDEGLVSSAAAEMSDEDLLAEVKKRGLDLGKAAEAEDEIDEDLDEEEEDEDELDDL